MTWPGMAPGSSCAQDAFISSPIFGITHPVVVAARLRTSAGRRPTTNHPKAGLPAFQSVPGTEAGRSWSFESMRSGGEKIARSTATLALRSINLGRIDYAGSSPITAAPSLRGDCLLLASTVVGHDQRGSRRARPFASLIRILTTADPRLAKQRTHAVGNVALHDVDLFRNGWTQG